MKPKEDTTPRRPCWSCSSTWRRIPQHSTLSRTSTSTVSPVYVSMKGFLSQVPQRWEVYPSEFAATIRSQGLQGCSGHSHPQVRGNDVWRGGVGRGGGSLGDTHRHRHHHVLPVVAPTPRALRLSAAVPLPAAMSEKYNQRSESKTH